MRSYDYCHFEVCLGIDDGQPADLKTINELRKSAQRLVDEAVRQYIHAKALEEKRLQLEWDRERLGREIERIKQYPESEWTPEDKAKVKLLEDADWDQFTYDYEDDGRERF
jgi:hypothetical protein